MFTGLVEEVGRIERIVKTKGGLSIAISADIITSDLKIGDSVNVNGVCQTVVSVSKNLFEVDTIGETLSKTTLGKLKKQERVNLERALLPTTRMGGHFVLGHTDTTGQILNIHSSQEGNSLKIKYSKEFSIYLVNVGSIAIDGISLTVAENNNDTFMAAVIPHTWAETNLKYKKNGDLVNLEFDILGKYALNIARQNSGKKVDFDLLKKYGFTDD
jgi:riboflavin synthase